MSINQLIVNGGFETGAFPPWTANNAIITTQFRHSGFYAARLTGGNVNAYIYQFVAVNPGESFEFLVSLAKVGIAPSPLIAISISYHDAAFNFIGQGLVTNIPTDSLPDVNENDWIEIYQTTAPVPAGATQALVIINKLPLAGSADVVVDDVALLEVVAIPEPPEIIDTFTTGPMLVPVGIDSIRTSIINVTTEELSISINLIVCRNEAIIHDIAFNFNILSRTCFSFTFEEFVQSGDIARVKFSGDIRKNADLLEAVVNGLPGNEPSMFFRHENLIPVPSELLTSTANFITVMPDAAGQININANDL